MASDYTTMNKDLVFAVERKALENARETFVLDKFTDKKTVPTKSGDELKVHYWDEIDDVNDVYVLTEGVTPAQVDMVRVSVSGSVKHQGAQTQYTDLLMEQHENAGEFHKQTGAELGYALGKRLEKDAMGICIAGAGSTTAAFTTIDAALKEARDFLRLSNAPKFTAIKTGSTKNGTSPVNAGWPVFVSLADADLCRAATDFLSVEDYGYSDGIMPNEIGAIKSLGLRIIETAYATTGTAIALGEGGLGGLSLGGKNRIQYIDQPLGSEGSLDSLKQRGSSGVKSDTGFMVLKADRVIKILTA